jgi:neuromedin U receptor 1
MENMIFDEFMQKWTHPAETATSVDVNFVWNGSANGSDEVSIVEMYGPKRDPLYVVVPITVIYTIIFVTGFVGNICTCIVIAKNRNMHTATNYYLFSLAISDFLLLVTGMPQEIFFIWSKYPYVFGELFCILRGLCAETSSNATVLTITAFTVERYVAICHPFLSHTMSKLSRAWKFIVVVWIVSIGE